MYEDEYDGYDDRDHDDMRGCGMWGCVILIVSAGLTGALCFGLYWWL
jgi:hypothetical protein